MRDLHFRAHHTHLVDRQNSSASTRTTSTTNRYSMSHMTRQTYVALYDYDARTSEDLSFRKGDRLVIIDDHSLGEWWLAINEHNLQGYVPSNFLAKTNSVASQAWFFGRIKRIEAERLLSNADNPHGSFLVRQSETKEVSYALSIKDGDSFKHYRVKRTPTNLYYITPKTPFASLEKLVEHYAKVSITQPETEVVTLVTRRTPTDSALL